jgi:hypothetical protein
MPVTPANTLPDQVKFFYERDTPRPSRTAPRMTVIRLPQIKPDQSNHLMARK